MKAFNYSILFFFAFTSVGVFAQTCFVDCSERLNRSVDTLLTTEQMKKKIHETDPSSANHKILNDLKGCDFPKTQLNTSDGKTISISDFKGKPVFVSFWFSSCAACIAEIPDLNKLVKEYGESAVFLSINTDDIETLKEFLKTTPYNARHAYITREAGYKEFCTIGGFPSNMILDKTGKVVEVWCGGESDPTKKDEFYKRIKTGLDKLK